MLHSFANKFNVKYFLRINRILISLKNWSTNGSVAGEAVTLY